MLFVIANKQDVSGAASAEEIEKQLKLSQFDGKHHYVCVPASGKSGKGVKEAMARLAKEMKNSLKEKKAE